MTTLVAREEYVSRESGELIDKSFSAPSPLSCRLSQRQEELSRTEIEELKRMIEEAGTDGRDIRVLLNMSYTGALVVLVVLLACVFCCASRRDICSAPCGCCRCSGCCACLHTERFCAAARTEPLPREFLTAQAPQIHTGIPALNSTINPALSGSLTQRLMHPQTPRRYCCGRWAGYGLRACAHF